MASDANLIKGARDAYSGAVLEAQAGKGLDMMFNTAMTKMQESEADTRNEINIMKEQKRQTTNKFYEVMEKAQNSATNLSQKHYAETEKMLKGLKGQYDKCPLNDEGCRRDKMAQMAQMTTSMNNQKSLRDGNKEAYKNGLLSKSLNDEQLKIMTAYMDPDASNYEVSYGRQGEEPTYSIEIDVPDPENPGQTIKETKEYKESEITKMFDKQVDAKSMEISKKNGVDLIKAGQNGEAYDATKQTAKYNGLITEQNLDSFTHDNMGYGSFIEDISRAGGPIDAGLVNILKKTPNMSRLGISPKEGEENWYDTIDDEDRKMMVEALTNSDTTKNPFYNADLHKEVVVDYYQQMSKKQHDQGVILAQKAAASKQREEEFELYKETHKNNLRIELADAKDENERRQISIKFENDMKKKAQDYYNKVNQATNEESVVQENLETQWNNIDFDEGEKPVSKAQKYTEAFRNILGNDEVDIQYGTDFVDEQGNTINKGYYQVINVEEGGKTVQVNQLISQGEDMTYDDVNRYKTKAARIKKGNIVPTPPANDFDPNDIG